MLNTKQITVIASVVVLMALLLSLDIKGLVKPKDQQATRDQAQTGAATASTLTIANVSETAKQGLNANLAQQITALENRLQSASDAEKTGIEKQLARQWEDVNQPAPAAFYYAAVAEKESNYANWLKAGDTFTEAYQDTQDTVAQPELVQKAINAYQKALSFNDKSLDARTGLGSAYVSGTANPMQGIQLLLEVVKEDPENVKANMNLGLFSMRSGQFDKAVNRFKTVIKHQPSPESWFYLASSYENLGMKKEAIDAYEQSKGLAADPGLSQFIDKKVKELK
ncbi:tetratricopeptide repeat protein (plasmid) [Pedobacter sp. BS3]|uniref:tetratricopeptide repeat protein n=1 Tax=Pedobacter sp. BS3 TaxID=2567937 RepID=UPI0011F0162F|nr:tetratricopeptide repeat protein [Pedobacter sp. BS3]TZF86067.1 tetratricopeptide repeat protein [Pedobacter sp. BS3]